MTQLNHDTHLDGSPDLNVPDPLPLPPELAPSVDRARIEAAVREILAAIGEDPDRDGLLDTPARVARMYAETCAGLHEDPARHLKVTFDAGHDEMIMVRDIALYSMCEHHLVRFFGTAHVAYILMAEKGDALGTTTTDNATWAHNNGQYSLYLTVAQPAQGGPNAIKPGENLNPVKTLRARYDAWRKTQPAGLE